MAPVRLSTNLLQQFDAEHGFDFEYMLKAVEGAEDDDTGDVFDAALRAASAMPPDASDFDRGLAAGFALAILINKAETE